MIIFFSRKKKWKLYLHLLFYHILFSETKLRILRIEQQDLPPSFVFSTTGRLKGPGPFKPTARTRISYSVYILRPVRSACVWFGLVTFFTLTRLLRLSGLYSTEYPVRGPLRCHLSGSSHVTRISVDDIAWDLTRRGGPVGGPGGIWIQYGASGDQPAVLCMETLNRYHTPKSAERIESG